MIILYIIIWTVALIIQYYVAKQFESVAADKGYQGSRFFHLPFWLGLPGWLLVIALPDRGNRSIQNATNNNSQASAQLEEVQPSESFVWHPVDETAALVIGETNIKCANCHRVQFKGNKVCNQCGAKFTSFQE